MNNQQLARTNKASSPHDRIPYRKPDGTLVTVFVPHTPIDVDQQPDVPAAILACVALAPSVQGRRVWSPFTLSTLNRLQNIYGDEVLRRHLTSLLTEMQGGFKPANPVGLYIHRVRQTPTQSSLV